MTIADVQMFAAYYLIVGLFLSLCINLCAAADGAWGATVRTMPDAPPLFAHAVTAFCAVVSVTRDAVLWPWAVAEVLP